MPANRLSPRPSGAVSVLRPRLPHRRKIAIPDDTPRRAVARIGAMLLNLNQIGQIGLPPSDIERSQAFYCGVVGLRKLYLFGDLPFFDCAGVRLLFEKVK